MKKIILILVLFLFVPILAQAQIYQAVYSVTAATANSTGTTQVALQNNPIAGDYAIEATNTAGTNPTLDVTWQMSRDGVTWWDLATVTQFTASGKSGIHITNATTQVLPLIRIKYTIGGTSSPAWTIKAWVVYTPQAR